MPGRLQPARGRRGGYAIQRLRPYGPYGPGGEDEGPALADLAAFFFLPIAGELTANSTLFFFDLCRYGYGYSYSKRPYCYSSPTASSFPLERFLRPDFFGCFFSSSSLLSFSSLPLLPIAGPTTYSDDRNRVRIRAPGRRA
ncbi:hypothetical protein L249_7763 [Ophiocordyceps polyrhachis-furcata BCC 54312]|uniref:Uncharacterized protein n=1 Tax=Ophiocordyceps polyrhachis-furcata BCC 54312 TaxID=1330021 RepID=A0A367L9X8_9HYPO|nr:hypothetical protein L249_7763 [Ophiocordyceps polyrhachis-furcata BCC 54312]